MGHDHVSSYDNSTGWFHEADSNVINISCIELVPKSSLKKRLNQEDLFSAKFCQAQTHHF
jgi:hypothetical protein